MQADIVCFSGNMLYGFGLMILRPTLGRERFGTGSRRRWFGISLSGHGDFIYAIIRGLNNYKRFYKYTMSTDSWTPLAETPQNLGMGADLIYYSNAGGDYIYCAEVAVPEISSAIL